jgi:DNA-binding XRE family transcriptional regulator
MEALTLPRDVTNPLYQARADAGFSNRKFAQAAGISLSTLQRLEAGDVPTVPVARALVAVLHPDAAAADLPALADLLRGDLQRWHDKQAAQGSEGEGSSDE